MFQNKPYVMHSESTGRLSGNQRYEGESLAMLVDAT